MGFHSRNVLNVPGPRRFITPRRFGFICFSRSFGGLELTTLRVASLLARRGALPIVIVPEGSPMHAEAKRLALPTRTIEPRIKYGDISAAFRLARLFRSEKLDSAIFFRSQDIHLGAIARMGSSRTHLVFYQQMQSGIGKKDFLHDAVYRRLSSWLTLTDIMRDEVLRWTNMPPPTVHVAPLGRDPAVYDPSRVSRSAAREALGLPARAFVVGILGRLDRQKGQVELLKTFSEVRARLPNALYVIAGDETKNDTGMRAEIRNLASSLDDGSRIRILPPTENVPQFMRAIDVFAMPSYSETYGLVLIEAMAMGIPVIATDSGGVPELVRHGKEGILVEPKNVSQLAEAIVLLGKKKGVRERMGRSGRERFLSRFDESRCTDILVGHLSSL